MNQNSLHPTQRAHSMGDMKTDQTIDQEKRTTLTETNYHHTIAADHHLSLQGEIHQKGKDIQVEADPEMIIEQEQVTKTRYPNLVMKLKTMIKKLI